MNPQFGTGMPFVMPQMQPMPQMQFVNPMMMVMNQNADEEWLKGFQMGVEEVNNMQKQQEASNVPKINAIFKTTQGLTTNMRFDFGTTIDQALGQYLKRVGKPELIGNLQNKICFLYNAKQLNFGDQSKVEVFFNNMVTPKIVVNDTQNVIGA